jgi:hypothetical protein
MLVSVLAVAVLSILRGRRVDTRVMRVPRVIGMAADTGKAVAVTGEEMVTGEEITGIRTMDILGSAITVGAMATHITVIAPDGTIHTDIIIPTATDTRCI